VLGALCLYLTIGKISAQSEECGFPDMTYPEWQTLMSGCSNPQVAGSFTWYIPIWITLVRQNNGFSDMNDYFSPLQLIDGVNSYFDNGMQFYVCGVSYINSDAYYDLQRNSYYINNILYPSELPGLEAEAHNLNPNEYPKGYIDVFLLGSCSPNANYANLPAGSYRGSVLLSDYSSNILAHELGHYFGLLHTYQGGPIAFTGFPNFAQYVHHATNPENFPVILSNGTYGCHQTGDFICDTPADSYNAFIIPPSVCTFSNCQQVISCTIPNDPLGLPYNPDPTSMMGVYGCKNRFTTKQNQIMVDMFTGHPDWAFLYDAEVPTCQELPYDRGIVIRNCEDVKINDNQDAPPQTPMEEVGLAMQNISSFSCPNITDGNGVYETFLCLNNPPYTGADLLSLLPDVEYISPLIGVDVGDLVLISKHVLAIEPFENPFQIIAADANNSGSVTTFDIVELRKLILGINNHLPNNSNWRYVPDYCFEDNAFFNQFYDPLLPPVARNPFDAKWTNPDEPPAIPPATNKRSYGSSGGIIPNAGSWMDHVTINPFGPVARNSSIPWSFTGIKVGDVNCDAALPFSSEDPDESFTTVSHAPLSTNQIFTLHVKTLEVIPIAAWQLGIDFAEDSLQILQIQNGSTSEAFSLDNFGLTEGDEGKFRALNFSENGAGQNLNNKTLFKLVIRALKPIANIGARFRLKNSVLPKKFYSADGNEVENMGLYLEVVNGYSGLGTTDNIGNAEKVLTEDTYHLSAYPIPFTSEISLDFFLPKDEQVHLSVFDSFGRLIAERSEVLPQGPNSLKIGDLAKQPAAFYWYSFEAGGQTLFGKIVKN